MNIVPILLLAGNIIFNSAGNILMKIGIKRTENINLASFSGILHGFILNPPLIFGAFSYAISLIFYLFVLKKMKLSIAYPISVSCAIIIVTLVSWLILKETVSLMQIAGTAIIMLGIVFIVR